MIELGDGRHLRLHEVLGKGTTATVFRGLLTSQNDVRRAVAVKLFGSLSSEDEHVLASLLRTARRLACVDHPNVVRVYECGLWRAQPFIVSELIEGVSLSALQETYAAKRRRVPLDVALFVACEIGEALAGARVARDLAGVQLGMNHHNVSPREVLLSWRGEVKVADFEASMARAASSSVRSIRGVASRATSMAPEVAQGVVADARSDVFSFGVLLRELFIGPRFPAGLTNTDAVKLAREGYVQPMTFQPQLPPGLASVMDRALEIDPEARYPNACAMVGDLSRVAFSMGVGDGRYFLKSALSREWSEYADEVTAERNFASPDQYEPYEGECVELKNRRR